MGAAQAKTPPISFRRRFEKHVNGAKLAYFKNSYSKSIGTISSL